ncbi:DUF2235 domain-containing protein [Sulfurirhabdus autotrophica]|uniref:Putative alpha/beta hydrolase family protein DUF2235 n=1 Tax=Sulfurirhabdus autotrophica TaxID=1706046 RepID=A0A4R3Y033_9PROT|nr:DUF2235 domain-containing protein [Sulfurirhabdus autotrophica]TCV85425.1 putative alpha/beta hydrolase family protein DUF2235 [Sulfurirhabdus autotrophica]
MPIEIDLNATQRQDSLDYNLEMCKKMIEGAVEGAIPKGQFVYFAAFDGTNNDKNNVHKPEQQTNVAQLWEQYEVAMGEAGNEGLHGRYFPGLGTEGKPFTESWYPAAVTAGVVKTAEDAYKDFGVQASDWLKDNPDAPVSVALTGFSRGVASAAIFSQLLYKNGLVDLTGKVLIEPGKVMVKAGVLFDPVATGVKGNMAFPPNVKNCVAIKALNEYRKLFLAIDYSKQADIVTTLRMYGNHCDVGGGYDNGFGALTLQAATQFLQKSGLPVADVPPGRERENALDKFVIHSEQFDKRHVLNSDDPLNYQLWEVTNSVGWGYYVEGTFKYPDKRLFDENVVVTPAYGLDASGRRSFTLYSGEVIKV